MLSFDDIDLNIKKEKVEVKKIRSKDIAVIGISLRLPKANNLEEFWCNLTNGIDCIDHVPTSRQKDITKYLKYTNMDKEFEVGEMGYIDDIDKFDYKFFGLSPNEAKLMDPNQRVFLQTAWNALEDSGYGGKKFYGSRTGVYIGYGDTPDYSYSRLIDEVEPKSKIVSFTGNLSAMIASRISYILNLRGPSVTIDTTCSSSLVALHMACQGIRNGDCDAAIVGGVKISVLPLKSKEKLGIESSNDRTMAFDDNSDGASSGEGVVALIIKPLDKAIKDNDSIYSVIKGSSINQDGRSIGITAPNPEAQEDVLIRAWKEAEVNPEDISYVEAHGTGTNLGDPIEIDGLTRAFSKFTDRKQFCAVSALKSNIGHLDSCSGLAGVVKAILCLKHKTLVPVVNFTVPNCKIDFEESPVYIVNKTKKWNSRCDLRKCGVSSFGLSGCNCHVVLEEWQEDKSASLSRINEFDMLSVTAKSQEALENLIKKYITFIENIDESDLMNFVYTANTGRGEYEERVLFIFSNKEELLNNMKSFSRKNFNSEKIFITNREHYNDINFQKTVQDEIDSLQKNCQYDLETLIKIAGLYVNGGSIDWNKFYKKEKRKKIHIPGYEFEKIRVWLNIPDERKVKCLNSVEKEEEKKVKPTSIEEISKVIADTWSEYLGITSIGLEDNYYSLGGDSLIGIQIVNRLKNILDVDIKLKDLSEGLTIKKLSSIIMEKSKLDNSSAKNDMTIKKAEKREYYPLSSAQKRMYVSQVLEDEKENKTYNIFGALDIEGKLDIDKLKHALNQVTERHEILRTSFKLVDGKPVQIVNEDIKIELETMEIDENNIDKQIDLLINSFDLSAAPLTKYYLLHVANDKYIFVYNMNHIISDGVSVGIFMDEVSQIYNGNTLEPLKLQYKDYAVWQNKIIGSEIIESQRQYWINKFSGDLPTLDLLPDYSNSLDNVYEGSYVRVIADLDIKRSLNEIANKRSTTLFNVLLAAYYVLLMKYSKQEDIIIGSPFSGRQNSEIENLMGMFVNTIALRSCPNNSKKFNDFLEEVKTCTMEAIENQDYQFDMLVEELNLNRQEGKLFDTFFALQNMKLDPIKINDVKVDFRECNIHVSPYKVSLISMENSEGINLIFEYQKNVFKRETVEGFAESYISILEQITEDDTLMIEDIKICNEYDKAECDILENEDLDFNF
ncbi:MAG: polyketide synthase [Clostridium sp.]|nr:polyketide synthase [Clostridium sp.]